MICRNMWRVGRVVLSLTIFAMSGAFAAHDAFAGCGQAVAQSYPAGGYGRTELCTTTDLYWHTSQTSATPGPAAIRVLLYSSDGVQNCNSRSNDSGLVWGYSVSTSTSGASVYTCSHPVGSGYRGTGIHWVNSSQTTEVSQT